LYRIPHELSQPRIYTPAEMQAELPTSQPQTGHFYVDIAATLNIYDRVYIMMMNSYGIIILLRTRTSTIHSFRCPVPTAGTARSKQLTSGNPRCDGGI